MRETAIPVATVTGGLATVSAVLVVAAGHYLGWSRDVLGAILLSDFPMNCFALVVCIRSALLPPRSRVMDTWVEQFMIGSLAGLIWAFIGIEEIWPVINTNVAESMLLLGVLFNQARPILFMRRFWRFRGRNGNDTSP